MISQCCSSLVVVVVMLLLVLVLMPTSSSKLRRAETRAAREAGFTHGDEWLDPIHAGAIALLRRRFKAWR